MFDAARFHGDNAERHSRVLADYGLERGCYVLATVHRQENTDDPERLGAIFEGLQAVAREMPVALPLHPRTQSRLDDSNLLGLTDGLTLLPPVGYLDMVMLERGAAVVTTDSGGVQKEAYFHGVPCVTLREETEWTELVDLGWNRLAPPGTAEIAGAVLAAVGDLGREGRPYGDGDAAERVANSIASQS